MRQDLVDFAVSVAAEHGIDAALLCTVMAVESGGQPTYADGSPVMLCESLHFYRRLPKEKRAAAVKAGLATPRQPKNYAGQETPAKREARLARMIVIDETAAFEAVSMGLGQVMGWHYADLGYGSAKEMYEAFRDPRAQVEGIYRVLVSLGALAPLQAHEWAKVAALYNGAGYARNHYDAKLAAAFATWSLKFRSGQVAPPAADTLGLGSEGPAVTAIQGKLASRGLPVRVDGVYGPKVHAAVAAFQAAHGIVGTGVVDQTTADSIMAETILMPQGAREVATAASRRFSARRAPDPPAFSRSARSAACGDLLRVAASCGSEFASDRNRLDIQPRNRANLAARWRRHGRSGARELNASDSKRNASVIER